MPRSRSRSPRQHHHHSRHGKYGRRAGRRTHDREGGRRYNERLARGFGFGGFGYGGYGAIQGGAIGGYGGVRILSPSPSPSLSRPRSLAFLALCSPAGRPHYRCNG
eukprot:TRINITY_DN606_c0_g1_i2.p3 TRINITY_DN606_c0_g1~~TRINITY_DN606_c0_g1_i2.p3  ORF type:complete len:106 (+),score=14.09 TRINITY_DN606_c0_g1_i2:260-577(+)